MMIKHFSELSKRELYDLLKLREEIFILEQSCLYQDIDNLDFDSIHVLCYQEQQLAAYLRILKPQVRFINHTISRVVVASEFRKTGLGNQVLQEAINYLKHQGFSKIEISSQVAAKQFYLNNGFVVENSSEYLEDNIPHVKMFYQIIG